jgi:hypothetical protein
MLANAVGGVCVDGDVGCVCANAGDEEHVSAINASRDAARILMRHVMSNRNATRVFAETHENAREKGRGQREYPDGTPT